MTSILDDFAVNDSRSPEKPYGCPAVVTNGWRRENVRETAWDGWQSGRSAPTIELTGPATPLYSGAQIVTKERYRFGTLAAATRMQSTSPDVMRAMLLYSFDNEDEIDVEFNSDGNVRFTVYKGAKEVDHFTTYPTWEKSAQVEPSYLDTAIHWEEDYLRFTINGRTVWTSVTTIRTPMHLIFNAYEPTHKNPNGRPHRAATFTILRYTIDANAVR